jgi:hypothetical protein
MGYLEKPDWEANVFSWHPVLLVAGFFCSQVITIRLSFPLPLLIPSPP